jgi:sulfite exporter TauE/SafE
MAAFWTGNLPVLLGLGVSVNVIVGRLRRHVPILSASVIFCVGLFTVTSRVNLPAFAAAAIGRDQFTAAAVAPMPGACPCHRKQP